MKKVYLLDLDGTLLKVKTKIMVEIVDKALSSVGLVHKLKVEKKFSGRTDRDIFGMYIDVDSSAYDELKISYIQQMEQDLKDNHVLLLKGADELSNWLVEEQKLWGLLTGNFETSGLKKVSCSGFPLTVELGFFGDNHSDRNELAATALPKCQEIYGSELQPKDIVIIGDTPKDVICAKVNDYTSVAISTGNYSSEDLAKFEPDYLISSLDELTKLRLD